MKTKRNQKIKSSCLTYLDTSTGYEHSDQQLFVMIIMSTFVVMIISMSAFDAMIILVSTFIVITVTSTTVMQDSRLVLGIKRLDSGRLAAPEKCCYEWKAPITNSSLNDFLKKKPIGQGSYACHQTRCIPVTYNEKGL